ncbi:Salicylate carboxymethyltransferase [Capsicum annuum]|nr:Salicylate carboxymethyltransferase [Capsicum annuum]
MTTESQMMGATTPVGANNIVTSSRANAPPTMAPAEKPKKFSGIGFKRGQQKMFFYLTTLCLQRFTSEDAPEWNQDIKETVGALERKYKTEDAGIKKFLVARFLDFKMIDNKSVVSQVQELQVIIHDLLAEVAAIVEKLPPLWKDFKNYLKHKRKEMTIEDFIVRLRIEEDNKGAERRSKGNVEPYFEPVETAHDVIDYNCYLSILSIAPIGRPVHRSSTPAGPTNFAEETPLRPINLDAVYEYLDTGNLEQWLHGDVGPSSPLTWEIRMDIILGTAKGGLNHIKSSNILLDKKWNPKVSDFGLAKLLGAEKSYITTRIMGTFGPVFWASFVLFLLLNVSGWQALIPLIVPNLIEKNKGNIYMSSTSPPSVIKAYYKQYGKDFTNFLKYRSEELMKGGKMVLTFLGRENEDPSSKECCYIWELLSMALNELVVEGLIEEEKLDAFNIPQYTPSPAEVKYIVEKENSFTINRLEATRIHWNASNDHINGGYNVSRCMRAVAEPLLVSQFGPKLMDLVFQKYEKIIINATVSLTKKK